MRKNLTMKVGVLVFALGLFFALPGAIRAQNAEKQTGDNGQGSVIVRDSRGNGYRGVSNQTGVAAESLKEWYSRELELNPQLAFGHFVAANVIAKNHEGLSAQTILTALRGGKTLGQILSAEGWEKNKIKAERKRLKRELHGKEDYAYRDSGKDWKF